MKTIENMNRTQRTLFTTLVFSILLIVFQGCKNEKTEDQTSEPKEEVANVIEIVSEDMDFQMPDTIPSGWNTFRYKNSSPHTHFFLVDKYPEGKTSEDARKHVAPVFDSAMAMIMDGNTQEGFNELTKLPEWFSEVVFVGGSGLVSSGEVAHTTMRLDPGDYIIECYVKMSNGVFHTSMGMTKDITVTNTDSGLEEPNADISIEISSEEGIVLNDTIRKGTQTFSVHYKDQRVHENFVGHDINLVKLEEGADLEVLEDWMNWASPTGLMDPAPEGFTFMGGVNDMPKGHTGYFTANLDSGSYVLISEVPNSSAKNMLKTFEIGK